MSARPSPSSSRRAATSPRTPPRWSRSTTIFSPQSADCRTAIAPGAPAVRRELKSNTVATYKVNFGDVDARLRQGRACVPYRPLAAPRRRSSDRGPWHPRRISPRHRRHSRSGPRPRRRTTCSSRSPRCSISTNRSCASPRRRSAAASARSCASIPKTSPWWRRRGCMQALDQMDRGPPRAFHQCGAGARPVLVDRHRGRRECQSARHPRQSHPRRRRLCAAGRQHSRSTPPR